MNQTAPGEEKTASERLFEEYLHSVGLHDFSFEKPRHGTRRRPDYGLAWEGQELLFDVKEFRATAEDRSRGGGFFDPYPPVREKLDAGREKFRELKQYCCSLVLYNVDKPLVLLDWEHIYGAMLGNLGFAIGLDIRDGEPVPQEDKVRTVFLEGGKMLRYRGAKPIAPQNQTLSAVIVLEHFPIGEHRFRAYRTERERELGRELTSDENLALADAAQGTDRDFFLRELRVVVHENPYARIPLPRGIFRGRYDERYGEVDGAIGRIFAGDGVLQFAPEEG